MNNSGTDEEEEEDDEQEEGDDFFHESLDRILSSSNSSTPASEDDDPLPNRTSSNSGLNKHDWISDAAFSSSSLQQRRDRLLTSLGLSSSDFSRSVSSVHLSRIHPDSSPVPRSKSLTSSSASTRNQHAVDHNAPTEVEVAACVIRNLDTGKEFEVNEDGTWKKVREVGTGRQMTMDEFQMCVGHSPIVQELMRRQGAEETSDSNNNSNVNQIGGTTKCKKKGSSWLRSIRTAAGLGRKERRISDETDQRPVSVVKDGPVSAAKDGPERVQVRQCGKSWKELSALYKNQEIQAHNGSIWSVRFSLDGKYLASAGEDCVIHVWRVVEAERKGELLTDRLEDARLSEFCLANGSPRERRRRGRMSVSRNSMSLDHAVIPETVFGLMEKPDCSFQGHVDDVLDLSWSKSQLLLSSSMDKTVRLWNLSSKTCLNIFSHNDYVTCIQFNPVDDRYFISGSLDAKVRIWSIPDHQVVDWNDMHEMVTAACYTPDGQGALVGSYKGSCRLYNTTENKLQPKSRINLQNKKKKSHLKKITGFQFAPGSSSEVLITSADSRVRVVDGVDLVHKFKGFRNTNSQISASITRNGKYVVCASEDSHVYVWKHKGESRASRSKDVTITRSYEHFYCQDVSVVTPWPGIGGSIEIINPCSRDEPNESHDNMLDETLATLNEELSTNNGPFCGTVSSVTNGYFFDRLTTTWPEEPSLLARKSHSTQPSLDLSNGVIQNRSAWGLAIVTASLRGKIRTFQNFGLPVRI